MAKSKTTIIFEDELDADKQETSPEDKAAWEEMEKYFSESLSQFKEGKT